MKTLKTLVLTFTFIPFILCQSFALAPLPGEDPLPSWNDAAIKEKIIYFVQSVTDPSSPDFVPPRERVAALDMDGTIVCEHPINFQRAIALERLRELAAQNPSLAEEQPYKAAVEFDDEYQANSNNHNYIFLTAFKDYPVHEFHEYAKDYMLREKQAPFDRKFNELYYQPGAELVQYLQDNNFRVYICSTTEENCIRVLLEDCMGLEHVAIIGNEVDLTFSIVDGKPHFRMHDTFRQPENRKDYKCVYILNQIGEAGQAPIFAFGNSMGDFGMLTFAGASHHKNLVMILDHDDPDRELEYHTEELLDHAKNNGWEVISMKRDFKEVFPSS